MGIKPGGMILIELGNLAPQGGAKLRWSLLPAQVEKLANKTGEPS